jgi:protein-S-isoprenylcysteine O-methyltransferase Ste14
MASRHRTSETTPPQVDNAVHELANSPNHQFTKFGKAFVWLGGGFFVGSLAFCAYSYLVTWTNGGVDAIADGPTAKMRPPWQAFLINAALFTAFAAHHSVFARDTVKARVARIVPEPLQRSVFVWIASLLLVAACALWQTSGSDVYDLGGWPAYGLAAAQIAGIWLIASAARVIDPLELAGIRPHLRSNTLQIRGPYRWIRHPIYLGWMIAVFGAAHMTAPRLAFAAISSFYLVIAIPWEERSLAREFPDEYPAYQRQVKWRVVPYVY